MSRVLNYLFIFGVIFGKDLLVFCKEANVYWREYRGSVPKDALPTGHGTYIAQVVLDNGGVVPGTLYPGRKSAVSEGQTGRVEFKNNLKILCTPEAHTLKWEYVNTNQLDGKFLENCVVGGFEIGSSVYIGKIFHEGEWKIGKVFPANAEHTGLRVWWNSGQGYHPQDFQILMVV